MIQIHKNFNLNSLNTLGLSSQAEFYAEVTSRQDIHHLRQDDVARNLKWSLLGGGSNVVLPPEIPGLVVRVSHQGRDLMAEDNEAWYVQAGAGENWHQFVQWTLEQGYWGLENLSLIPGTVGAAPIQNIGAYGVEVKDLIHSVVAVELASGEEKTFSAAECGFAYRDSFFKQEGAGRFMILDVVFRLPKKNQLHLEYGDIKNELARNHSEITPRSIAEAVVSIRRSKLPDPQKIGNAGSFFKNPIVSGALRNRILSQYADLVSYAYGRQKYKLAAGWLIDRAGWKGRRLGPVGMFERQALVLVNHGGATAPDVWKLAEQIQKDVLRLFDVQLEPEPIRW